MHETRNTREDYFYYLAQDPLGLNDEIYNVVISFALIFSPIRSMILDSFLMILVRYNFWTMRRFLLPLRLLLLDWKSELLEMIVLRRYIFTPSRLKLLLCLYCFVTWKQNLKGNMHFQWLFWLELGTYFVLETTDCWFLLGEQITSCYYFIMVIKSSVYRFPFCLVSLLVWIEMLLLMKSMVNLFSSILFLDDRH